MPLTVFPPRMRPEARSRTKKYVIVCTQERCFIYSPHVPPNASLMGETTLQHALVWMGSLN